MAQNAIVKISRDGSLATVSTLSPTICRLLEEELSYTRMVHVRGKEAAEIGGNMRFDPIVCYRYVGGKKTGYPLRFVFPSGFLQRVVRTLRAAGYAPVIRDLRPHPKPQVFTPHWDRLAKVRWKWRQKWILETLLKRQYGQVRCVPGYGKSFLIYAICAMLPKARIAVATHSIDVVEQIHGELCQRLPNVGLCTSRNKRTGSRVTCYSGKSLHHCDKPVDLLLVDEVHEWGTDDYLAKVATQAFRFARRWAFSANIGDRTDNADFELEGLFGPMVVRLDYPTCVKHRCVTPIEIHWHDVVMDYDPAEGLSLDVDRERAAIWQNEYRNELIASLASATAPHDQTLISVRTIEHAMFLKRLLPDFSLCYSHNGLDDIDRSWYVDLGCIGDDEPPMTVDRRRQLKKEFEAGTLKKVIANSVWKRGVDFRNLQELFRADAESTMISDTQIPGRTSRIGDAGKSVSRVHDFEDQFNGLFRSRAGRRRGHYAEIGWPQIRPVKVKKPRSKLLPPEQRRLF